MSTRLSQTQNVDYNARRKQQAAAKAIQPKGDTNTMDASGKYDLSTPEGKLDYFRDQIKKGKASLAESRKHLLPSRRTKETALLGRGARLQQQEQRKQISSELANLSAQEKQVELDVARNNPELAKPEFKAAALQEAKSATQKQVNELQKKANEYSKLREQYLKTNNAAAADRFGAALEATNAELRVYQDALSGNENNLIKSYFSGSVQSQAQDVGNIVRSNISSATQSKQAFEQAKQTNPQLQEALKILKLPANVSQAKFEKALTSYNQQASKNYSNQLKQQALNLNLQQPNTFDVSTGTYTDALGNKFSSISAPKGATLIDTSIGGTYVSGQGWQSLSPSLSKSQGLNIQLPSKNYNEKAFSLYLGDSNTFGNNLVYDIPSNYKGGADDSFNLVGRDNIDSRKIKSWEEIKRDLKKPFTKEGQEEFGLKVKGVGQEYKRMFQKGSGYWTEPIREDFESPTATIQKINLDLNELVPSFENKYSDLIKPDESGELIFVGSDKEYEQYTKDFSEIDKLQKQRSQAEQEAKSFKGIISDFGSDIGELISPKTRGGYTLEAGGLVIAGSTPALKYAGKFLSKPAIKTGLTGINALLTPVLVKETFNKELTPYQRIKSGTFAGLGTLDLGVDLLRFTRRIPKGTARVTGLSVESETLPFVRKRATVILEDSKGRVLYHVDKNTGLSILPGGALDKGESALKAAQRELFEETGLKVKLKPFDKVITEREANYIYKAVVDDLDKLIPQLSAQAKEVGGFRAINPGTYTGKTQFNVFGSKGVRAEDLYIGSRNKVIPEINNQISSLTKTQKTNLINKAKQELYPVFGKSVESLSNDALLKEYFLFKKGMQYKRLYINPAETFVRRGQPTFLRKRVEKPTLRKPETIVDFLVGRKPGQFKKFQKESPIVVGFGSRYDVSFSELSKYEGNLVEYLHATPSKIPGRKEFEVTKGKNVRGEGVLYFQPPTTPTGEEAYLGASYLGLIEKPPKNIEEIKFGFKRGTPTIYRTKAVAGEDLIFTKKAIRGTEFEVGAVSGTVFKVEGRPQKINLGGRRVNIQNIKLTKASKNGLTENEIQSGLKNINRMNNNQKRNFINRVKRETGRDYSYYAQEGYYVNPVKTFNEALVPQKQPARTERAMQETEYYSKPKEVDSFSNLLIGSQIKKPYSPVKYPKPGRREPYRIPEREINNYLVPQPYYPRKYVPSKQKYQPRPTPYKHPPYYYENPLIPRRPPTAQQIRKPRRPEEGIEKRKPKRGRPGYLTLPTVFEQLSFGGPRGRTAKRKLTGFEVFRFV